MSSKTWTTPAPDHTWLKKRKKNYSNVYISFRSAQTHESPNSSYTVCLEYMLILYKYGLGVGSFYRVFLQFEFGKINGIPAFFLWLALFWSIYKSVTQMSKWQAMAQVLLMSTFCARISVDGEALFCLCRTCTKWHEMRMYISINITTFHSSCWSWLMK